MIIHKVRHITRVYHLQKLQLYVTNNQCNEISQRIEPLIK